MASHELILLGQGPSMGNCPFDIETWAAASVLSHKGFENKSYAKIFCLDDPDKKPDEKAGVELAFTRKIPLMGWAYVPHVTELYPLKKIQERYNTYYFKNDLSYMIAYAMYLGYKSLLLWGVDEGPGLMYEMNRPYVTFWLGMATAMGVEWSLAPSSILWRKREVEGSRFLTIQEAS